MRFSFLLITTASLAATVLGAPVLHPLHAPRAPACTYLLCTKVKEKYRVRLNVYIVRIPSGLEGQLTHIDTTSKNTLESPKSESPKSESPSSLFDKSNSPETPMTSPGLSPGPVGPTINLIPPTPRI
jgi:hypothetical protein